jgi:N-acetylmuramoyl-L-alanine amidase
MQLKVVHQIMTRLFGVRLLNVMFLTFLVSLSVASSANTSSVYQLKTVVIDAGHGGHDAGCSGKHSKEKHIALDIALKLGAYIEELIPDVEVVYTRKTDVFVELHERAAIANRAHADLFISIHCNASASKSPYGTETYVMGLHKNKDNLNVAKRENAVILLEDDHTVHYDGFDPNDPTAHIIFTLHQSAHLDQSILFAQYIEDQFKNRVGRRSRGVKQAGFLVLYKTSMPSVLIETGFLTNSNEESFLRSEQGSDYMASAVFRAFRDYKEDMERGTELEASIPSLSPAPNGDVIEIPEPATSEYKHPEDQAKLPDNEDDVADNSFAEYSSYGEDSKSKNSSKSADQVDPYARVWMVQIYASSRAYKSSDPVFQSLGGMDVRRMQRGQLYKYVVGNCSSENEASQLQQRVRQMGFKDAFIVSFLMGELAEQ